MREALNFNMIPIVQDNIDGITINTSVQNNITSISLNGYYGYQSPLQLQSKEIYHNNNVRVANDNTCNMDVQYNNCGETEEMQVQVQNDIPRLVNRKRLWNGNNEFSQFKKPRQSEPDPFSAAPPVTPQKPVHLRKPTHNIPDLPRCIMEQKLEQKTNGQNKSLTEDPMKTWEDLLWETHGCSYYHWISSES